MTGFDVKRMRYKYNLSEKELASLVGFTSTRTLRQLEARQTPINNPLCGKMEDLRNQLASGRSVADLLSARV